MKDVYTLADLQAWGTVTAGEPVPLRLAVLGDPVAHSASPQMQNAALAACGIAARYVRLHIRPEEFAEALRLLAERGFIGVNCTIPHKGAALAAMDETDEHARRADGVNTIVFGADGKRRGFSTDGPGLARAVREQLGVNLADMRVLVLGAGGGAGRAVAMQCAFDGARGLTLINRSVEKLHPLHDAIAVFYPRERLAIAPWTDAALARVLEASDLVVNCSAVGMKPNDASPIPAAHLTARHLLYDTIYTAARTPLMRAADSAGARSANGLSMLLHQGALAFEHWFRRPAPLEVMRAALTQQSR
ncbi:MAG: shikimate dehydrogenase [Chthoniobacter sp.]|nr:shikimate dehydrogenase [Chthoniobacter sp.]